MIDTEVLGETLPGRWRMLATTFPMWLTGKKLNPFFTYAPLPGSPLALSDEVSYRTRSGATRRIVGVDRLDPETGLFTWRGKGPLSLLSSRWRVTHLSDDRDLIVLTFERSLVTPAGTDVIGRGPAERPDARALIPPDDTLHWLP